MADSTKLNRPIRSEANPPPSMIRKLGEDLLFHFPLRELEGTATSAYPLQRRERPDELYAAHADYSSIRFPSLGLLQGSVLMRVWGY
ncbi:unnamed protein product, partial [Linum tenue]